MNRTAMELNWLVEPKGETKHDAQRVCLRLHRVVFGNSLSDKEKLDDRWKKSGLEVIQDPEFPNLWGVICKNPKFEERVCGRIDESIWGTDLEYHLKKTGKLGELQGWNGYEFVFNVTHPRKSNGEVAFAKVEASLYVNDQTENYAENTKKCDYVIHWYTLPNSQNSKGGSPVLIWIHADKGVTIPSRFNVENYDELVKVITNKAFYGRIKIRDDIKKQLIGLQNSKLEDSVRKVSANG